MSALTRAKQFTGTLVLLRKRLNRCFAALLACLNSYDGLPSFDELLRFCTECSFSACTYKDSFDYCLDRFVGGFLFYFWLYTLGDKWIQRLLRSGEKVK